MLMLEGVIVKALSGYYYVKPLENGMAALGGENAIQCRARGIFKKKGVTPLVGDHVLYSHTENGEGMVDEILPRRSVNNCILFFFCFAFLVFSVREPDQTGSLLDKFLVDIEHSGLDTVICLERALSSA